ncbi:MAG: glycosyltransferase family 2 protein [Bacteroidota bacterium]
MVLPIIFWVSLFIILYTYLGYGVLLFMLKSLKNNISSKKNNLKKTRYGDDEKKPKVTFLVAAYNEKSYIEQKIANSLNFNYPKHLIQYYFVTDGSSDDTPERIKNYPIPADVSLKLFHESARKGKIAAVNRVMPQVDTPIVIFSDANTDVNEDAITNIVKHYKNPKVGAVAGEKRIQLEQKEEASSAGEGIYWKYESTLKKWDSEVNSVVGAAGELFSIRTKLYEEPPQDSIVEDFYMTMRIASKGYKVAYEPEAYAVETASASVGEELKRKIRIAAGGFQSVVRLADLLNIFKYGFLSFQYISHRVLRWTLAPLALVVLFVCSLLLASQGGLFYQIVLVGQLFFYLLAVIGLLLEKRKIKLKAFFVPYYFCVMNYAVFRGLLRYLSGSQSVMWERAKRA